MTFPNDYGFFALEVTAVPRPLDISTKDTSSYLGIILFIIANVNSFCGLQHR